ncbi:MAG TPA: SUMF1/EgtB/PvdO family nonheme iron enzyme [Thermoanaerobaculia bacterium]|nr:SUMF1/EgtB/PvdO family nonheme iron enzyme [Thermoanaerobaculia bacterium]
MRSIERYSNFDLRIEKGPDGLFRVRVSDLEHGHLGEAEARFTAPFVAGELERFLKEVGTRGRELDAPPPDLRKDVEKIGNDLFRAVFSGKVLEFWRQSLNEAERQKVGLRVRLRIREPELALWPWEFLYDPDLGFLALSPETAVVRYPEQPSKGRALGVKPPIRILVVTASPSGYAELEIEQEWQELKNSLAGLERRGRVVLQRLEKATFPALEEVRESFHILHFIGHGTFDAAQGTGSLVFETETGEAEIVPGKRLVDLLRNRKELRLVVLNACHGAVSSPTDSFTGVAQSLIWGGAPAVIAMRSTVADDTAIAFAQKFYKAVAGKVAVEEAVCRARNALFAKGETAEWAIPILYMRSPDGYIFGRPPKWKGKVAAASGAVLLGILAAAGYTRIHTRSEGPDLPPIAPPHDSVKGCPPIPDLEMVFKRIGPGTFTMGGEGGDAKRHPVTITKPFCMSAFEITRLQWNRLMHESPGKHNKWSNQPVDSVTWNRVQDFLHKLQETDPKAHFRLPTEAQWEYAARAGSASRFSFGDDPSELIRYGNCKSEVINDQYDATAPVGKFAPNDWGLYDMQGNVSEWVADWYAPYDGTRQVDPTGPTSGTKRVRRGGSYAIKAEHCGVAKRNRSAPDYKKDDIGFRIIRDVEE